MKQIILKNCNSIADYNLRVESKISLLKELMASLKFRLGS